MSREAIAGVLKRHAYHVPSMGCRCGWKHSPTYSSAELWAEHVADALLAALPPPPRGGDAAEEELGALLERLSIQGGVSFMRWESDGCTHAESAEVEVSGATPFAALRALDAALAEQQQQKSEESSRNNNAGANG